jgi:hypothetical protein
MAYAEPSFMLRLALALVLAGAGCAQEAPAAGTERGPCYGNGTCNEGMLCLSNHCVRPPPADCALVAEAVASLELGNYAPREERAGRVVALAAACREQHVSKDEGACLLGATTVLEATYCPKPLIAPGRGPVTLGVPVVCREYLGVLERLAQCAALPDDTRAQYRRMILEMRKSWDLAGQSGFSAASTAACAQGKTALEQGMPRMGCP